MPITEDVNYAAYQQDISGRWLFILCAIEIFLIIFMCVCVF